MYTFSEERETWDKNKRQLSKPRRKPGFHRTEDERNFIKKSNDTIYHIGLKKKASNWTWVSGRRLNFPQWINNLSRSDGEVASISWKSNDECMQDYLYICEFHKGNSKLQLSLKNAFKGKSIPKTLRRNKYIIMDPAGFTDV